MKSTLIYTIPFLVIGLVFPLNAKGDDAAIATCTEECATVGDEAQQASCTASRCVPLYSQAAGLGGSSNAGAASGTSSASAGAVVGAITKLETDKNGNSVITLNREAGEAITANITAAIQKNAGENAKADAAITALQDVIATNEGLRNQAINRPENAEKKLFGTQVESGGQSLADFNAEVDSSNAKAGGYISKAEDFKEKTTAVCNAANLLLGNSGTGCGAPATP